MKNKELIYLVNSSVGNITAHNLTAKEGYSVFKFKKILKELFTKFCTDESALISDCKIDNVRTFNARLSTLQTKEELTDEEQNELKEMLEKASEFKRLEDELLSEEVFFEGISPLYYSSWFELQNENKNLMVNGKPTDVLSGEVENILEGVLWIAPE